MEGDRAVRVEYAEGALIMYAANGKFGSFDWLSVGIPFCGDEQPAYFGLRTEHRY